MFVLIRDYKNNMKIILLFYYLFLAMNIYIFVNEIKLIIEKWIAGLIIDYALEINK